MKADKVAQFMEAGGQIIARECNSGDSRRRVLGASLLLSEVLEYVIKGLGVIPEIGGVKITSPDSLTYSAGNDPDHVEMLDGISDVAYTMYWNALAFGLPLEEGFDAVCDNNLEKFVSLGEWGAGKKVLSPEEWHCGNSISWPSEVVRVEVVEAGGMRFAVGKDSNGKVRKPSSFKPLDLSRVFGRSSAS